MNFEYFYIHIFDELLHIWIFFYVFRYRIYMIIAPRKIEKNALMVYPYDGVWS